MRKCIVLGSVLSLAVAGYARADISIQELFDSCPNGLIQGMGDTSTSIGFDAGSPWKLNAGLLMDTADNFNLESDPALPGLPPQAGSAGGIWLNSWSAETSLWRTDSFATRALAPAAQIDFAADNMVYFSFRLNNGGDSAVGMGFASGDTGDASFVAFGGMWNSYGPNQAAKNSLFISDGTLGQPAGPCLPLAYSAADSLNGKALIVGRLITSASGVDHLDLRQYDPGSTIGADPDAASWTTSYDITDPTIADMNADHLMIFMNGVYAGEFDAVRVGATWKDVTGVPEPASLSLVALGAAGLLRRRRS